MTPAKASQAFPQQQIHSADSNLRLCCTIHPPPAHLFLQCRCQPGTFPGTEPSPGDRDSKGHTQQQATETPSFSSHPNLSRPFKVLQGFEVQPRVLSHQAWRSFNCWMLTEICLAGVGDAFAHVPAPQTTPGRCSNSSVLWQGR